MLVNGQWATDFHPVQGTDDKGRFLRKDAGFRGWIGDPPEFEGIGDVLPAEAGRYHLYVALICPWANRTLIARALKGLDDVISVSVVEPWLGKQGWAFGSGISGSQEDPFGGRSYVHQLYTDTDPHYSGRATVPVLWDKKSGRIVSNESADIVRILDSGFGKLATQTYSLYPEALRSEIDALNAKLYDQLNNGVYQAGFATTQEAYEEAVTGVFSMLDALEQRLADGREWLFGDVFVETDIRLFVTLARFDAAYHGLFKCNVRQLRDYPGLSAYTSRVMRMPGVARTVDIEHIKQGYYSIKAINPTGIVPVGPDSPLTISTTQLA